MAFRTIETTDRAHLRWKPDFNAGMLIVGYHFPEHAREEPPDDHDFIEIQLCAGGRGLQQTSKGTFPFTPGAAMVIRPGGWHRHLENEGMDAYICCFESRLLTHELIWTLDEPMLNPLLWRPVSGDDHGVSVVHLDEPLLRRCISHFEALVQLGENDDPAERPTRLGYLTCLLACLGESAAKSAKTPAREVHPAVRRCISLMGEHLAEPWTCDELAAKLNINGCYLSRLFRSTLDTSPMAYLSQMRLQRAAWLLNRTDKFIAEIGMEVGWSDANYFARRFRAHFGISATEYRLRGRRHQAELSADPGAAFQWNRKEAPLAAV